MTLDLPSRLFPLHLSDIERFLLDDDRPAYPMAFVIEIQFTGKMDVNIFRNALEATLQRHPLLVSKIGAAKNRKHCWLKPDGTLPEIDIAALGVPINVSNEHINLEKEVGLRIWLRIGEDATLMTMQFHHACCDGIGSYRFIGDLLANYAIFSGSTEISELPNIDLKRLRGRADRCRLHSKGAKSWELTRNSIADGLKIVGKPCTPLAIKKASKPFARAPFPGLQTYHFSAEEANQLRDSAKDLGLMLNDLLILELFQSLHSWNAETLGREKNGHYRIMMPVDLRSTDDYETPACNVIGYTFLDRRGKDLADRPALATSIREETANIKHHRLGERFNDMLAISDYARPLKKLAMRLPLALCTAILSNVGDPSRRFLARFPRKNGCVVSGNLVMEHISGYPPIRYLSRVSVSIMQYRRELTISLRCDPYHFSMSDSEHFTMLFTSALRKHIPVGVEESAVELNSAAEVVGT